MRLFGWHAVRREYGNKFYLLPRKLTVWINPTIYAWGYWNFCKLSIGDK